MAFNKAAQDVEADARLKAFGPYSYNARITELAEEALNEEKKHPNWDNSQRSAPKDFATREDERRWTIRHTFRMNPTQVFGFKNGPKGLFTSVSPTGAYSQDSGAKAAYEASHPEERLLSRGSSKTKIAYSRKKPIKISYTRRGKTA